MTQVADQVKDIVVEAEAEIKAEEIVTPNFLMVESGMIPSIILAPEAEIPEDVLSARGTALILQGTNAFWKKNQGIHTIITSVTGDINKIVQDNIGDCRYKSNQVYLAHCNWQDYKLPADQFAYVMKYFQRIYQLHQSEAALIILLNSRTKKWQILPLAQVSARGGSVIYAPPIRDVTQVKDHSEKKVIDAILDDKDAKAKHFEVCDEYDRLYDEGYRIYGTIHSHCDFGAFHSGTDDADEIDFDGLHITIGNVLSGWSYSARFMIDGAQFPVETSEMVDGDLDEIEKSIDNVVLEDKHLALMMPKLLDKFSFKVQPVVHHTGKARNLLADKNWTPSHNWPDNWGGSHGAGLFNPDNLGTITPMTSWEEDQEWEENVIMESEAVRVFDYQSGETYLVKQDYYNDNADTMFDHHMLLDDAPISKKALAKHQEFLKSQKGN